MKLVKYSLTKQIADELERKIKDEEYKVGDKIPTEPDLVKHFDASRNTIREAVQSLIHAGLLQARQGDGTYVIAKERFQVEFFTLLNKANKKELYEMRRLLEEQMVVLACLNGTEEDFQIMEETLKKNNKINKEIKENIKIDIEFHKSIVNATHNNLLIYLYEQMNSYFHEFISKKLSIDSNNQDYIEDLHEKLFLAIKNRNPDLAKEVLIKIIKI